MIETTISLVSICNAMQSFRQSDRFSMPKSRIQLPVATEVIVSLSSLPLVSLLAVGQLVTRGLVEMGQQSEELFRGERLPGLPLMK